MTTKQIKKLVRANRPKNDATGFPDHVQKKVVEAAKVMLASGRKIAVVAKALGVSESSIERWVKKYKNGVTTSNGATAPATSTLSTPNETLYAVTAGSESKQFASLEIALTHAAHTVNCKLWKEVPFEVCKVARVLG